MDLIVTSDVRGQRLGGESVTESKTGKHAKMMGGRGRARKYVRRVFRLLSYSSG